MDVEVFAHLGLLFADEFRAGVAWRWHERRAEPTSLGRALTAHHTARDTWQRAAHVAAVYRADIPFGRLQYARGHWAGRLPAIDEDIAALTHHADARDCLSHADRSLTPVPDALAAPRVQTGKDHVPPAAFHKGEQLALSFTAAADADLTVRVHYRQVDQSASWLVAPTARDGDRVSLNLPSSVTGSPYSIQHFAEVRSPPAPLPISASTGSPRQPALLRARRSQPRLGGRAAAE